MKECQKWWNEKQVKETNEEFLVKLGSPTTQEQVIDVLVELTWRAALEWVIAECQEDGWGDCIALNVGKIEEELEEENIYNQDQWCESCRLKIEAAEDMEVVSVCNTCVKRNLK